MNVNGFCTEKACVDNHNLHHLELLWKERMTIPLWNLLPEDVFLKICKHVDSDFHEPTFERLKYTDIEDITYEVQKFNDVDRRTPLTFEELLALRSISIPTNHDRITPTEIIKPLSEDLVTRFTDYLNYREEVKVPDPNNTAPYELMRKITYDDPYLKKIFG